MRYFAFILALFILSTAGNAQEILAQQLPEGYQRAMRKQNRSVPRYYICGAGTWKLGGSTPAHKKCEQKCQLTHNAVVVLPKLHLSCKTVCTTIPVIHKWIRTTGIKFQYCHFQNWNNQIFLEEPSNNTWQGMKMCPSGHYAYGMRTKLTERDGLSGLILLCRNIMSSQHISEVLAFDGEGSWTDVVASSHYAVGFKAILRDSFIYGLHLQMAALPYIFAFNFQYQFPKNFNVIPAQIDKVVVINFGSQKMTKKIEIKREKQFRRIWQNDKGYLHGQSLSKISSQSLMASVQVGIPHVQSRSNSDHRKQQMAEGRRQDKFQTFKFGTIETYKVGQRQEDIVHIPPCTKYTILQSVYTANSDIPYILQLGYSNGQAVEYENIRGVYRGVATGEVETIVNMQKLKCS